MCSTCAKSYPFVQFRHMVGRTGHTYIHTRTRVSQCSHASVGLASLRLAPIKGASDKNSHTGIRTYLYIRGGSAGIRNLYSYVTSSGDIRYDNRSYAAIVQRKSRVRGQISAPSVPSCVCANELSFKICVFQVVKSPQSRRDRCYCYRRHVRTL